MTLQEKYIWLLFFSSQNSMWVLSYIKIRTIDKELKHIIFVFTPTSSPTPSANDKLWMDINKTSVTDTVYQTVRSSSAVLQM